jgi:hypothetical protein
MPRYVINALTRTIHSADCNRVQKNIVPWPRFEYDDQGWCTYCLPDGLPVQPKRTIRSGGRSDDCAGQMAVHPVPQVCHHVLQAACALESAAAERQDAAVPGLVRADHGAAGGE